MRHKLLAIGIFSVVLLTGTVMTASAGEVDANTLHTIGVVVYDNQNSEVQMFRQYYKEYIENCFPVEFFYSSDVFDWEDEKDYLEAAKEHDCEGIISFNATNLPEAMAYCEENGMYYMLGSGSVDPSIFNQVKDNEWFLGTIGPDEEMELAAGSDMTAYFAENDTEKNAAYIILSGGASLGNYMHAVRTKGMLEELQTQYGYQYDQSIEDIVYTDEPLVVQTGTDVTLGIFPGYFNQGDTEAIAEKLNNFLSGQDVSVIMSVVPVDDIIECIDSKEKEENENIRIGIVDCFSQQNYVMFEQKDVKGNPKLDYVAGKYGSMIGPAFAAMFNAVCGDTDMLRTQDGAFQLTQGFWEAKGKKEYDTLYGYTQGSVENAYGYDVLMKAIRVYTEEASFEELKSITEAWDVESVKERIDYINNQSF